MQDASSVRVGAFLAYWALIEAVTMARASLGSSDTVPAKATLLSRSACTTPFPLRRRTVRSGENAPAILVCNGVA
jgi:hypothetical protein